MPPRVPGRERHLKSKPQRGLHSICSYEDPGRPKDAWIRHGDGPPWEQRALEAAPIPLRKPFEACGVFSEIKSPYSEAALSRWDSLFLGPQPVFNSELEKALSAITARQEQILYVNSFLNFSYVAWIEEH